MSDGYEWSVLIDELRYTSGVTLTVSNSDYGGYPSITVNYKNAIYVNEATEQGVRRAWYFIKRQDEKEWEERVNA